MCSQDQTPKVLCLCIVFVGSLCFRSLFSAKCFSFPGCEAMAFVQRPLFPSLNLHLICLYKFQDILSVNFLTLTKWPGLAHRQCWFPLGFMAKQVYQNMCLGSIWWGSITTPCIRMRMGYLCTVFTLMKAEAHALLLWNTFRMYHTQLHRLISWSESEIHILSSPPISL